MRQSGGRGIKMVKKIAVFAAVVLGYVLTGMALSASQPGRAVDPASATSIAVEASIIK